METEDLRVHIEKIINESFDIIDEIYRTNQEAAAGGFDSSNSRLVFPKYRNEKTTRLSEQEIKFLFVERFNRYCSDNHLNLFYSIETPSEEPYDFRAYPKKHVANNDKRGVSAQFDMVIFDESGSRVCLIEFKNNSNISTEHEKDLLKLSVEGSGKLCYLISVANASGSNTLDSIRNKFGGSNGSKEMRFENITYICHCLNNRGSKKKKGFYTIFDGTVVGDYGWEKHNLFPNSAELEL